MALAELKDESLIRLYENIRQQVEAERDLKFKFLTSHQTKRYADTLASEMSGRGLRFSPILFSPDILGGTAG